MLEQRLRVLQNCGIMRLVDGAGVLSRSELLEAKRAMRQVGWQARHGLVPGLSASCGG